MTRPPATSRSTLLDSTTGARRWRSIKWGIAFVVVLAIGVGALFGSRLGKDPNLVETPLIGQPAPTVRVPELEKPGGLALPELRGQIVVVNFWASWCVACREEHAALTSAATNYRDRGVTFVGVDYQDQRDAAIRFLDELGRGDGYRYVADPGSRLALEFGVFGIPETYFLDRDGTIVAKVTGASNYPLLSRTLDDILAGRTPASRPEGQTFQR
ncbi:TlpA family protein disulfide reductase [Allosaccharopolyspora coralli]|uniref:TlpA family protein disulfide reductase n=1 Tax=Allosaccharopolyspora coralli TaxID=2665642 RepID=UPI001E4BF955|nr:redoxin domain-containing protein [Allosaccharopolyspora coralli]